MCDRSIIAFRASTVSTRNSQSPEKNLRMSGSAGLAGKAWTISTRPPGVFDDQHTLRFVLRRQAASLCQAAPLMTTPNAEDIAPVRWSHGPRCRKITPSDQFIHGQGRNAGDAHHFLAPQNPACFGISLVCRDRGRALFRCSYAAGSRGPNIR